MGVGASVSNRVLRVHLIKRFVPGLEGGGCIRGQTWGEGVPSRARVVQRPGWEVLACLRSCEKAGATGVE